MRELILILFCMVTLNTSCKTIYTKRSVIETVDTLPPYSQAMFDKCIEDLKVIEGFRSKPYWDVVAYSIGYGHQIQPDEEIDSLDLQSAEKLLIKDFKERVDWVHETYGFKNNQLLAAARFTFNLGAANTNKLFSKGNVEERWIKYCKVWCSVDSIHKKSNHLLKVRKIELELWKS